jgi:hypothetical protein
MMATGKVDSVTSGLMELGRVGSSEAIRWMDPQCSGDLGLVSRIARPFHHE